MLNTTKKETEYWDLYRADGRLESVIPSKGYDIPANMYHMTVEVIPTDKAGHLLITQRAFTKSIGPGKLEFPAGSVLSGEPPYVAARRELFEETGLKAKNMIKIGEYQVPRIHRTIYLAFVPDLKTQKITLQEGETIAYAVVTFQQWMEYIAQERFETSKFRNYTRGIIQKIEELVGVPAAELEDTEPAEEPHIGEDPFAKYRNGQPKKRNSMEAVRYETMEEFLGGEELLL